MIFIKMLIKSKYSLMKTYYVNAHLYILLGHRARQRPGWISNPGRVSGSKLNFSGRARPLPSPAWAHINNTKILILVKFEFHFFFEKFYLLYNYKIFGESLFDDINENVHNRCKIKNSFLSSAGLILALPWFERWEPFKIQ